MELFREIKEILNIKIRSDETLERNNKMVHNALLILTGVTAVMSIVDLKYGLYVSTYFLVLLVVFCWTPAKQFLLYDYGEVFFIRFPILYFFPC